jgi:hypothetical protein
MDAMPTKRFPASSLKMERQALQHIAQNSVAARAGKGKDIVEDRFQPVA